MVTGPPQSGTSLLMALLDGSREFLVYPDEPSFPIMLKARTGYRDSGHLGRDWLFGTPNPIHLNRIVREFSDYPRGFIPGKARPDSG